MLVNIPNSPHVVDNYIPSVIGKSSHAVFRFLVSSLETLHVEDSNTNSMSLKSFASNSWNVVSERMHIKRFVLPISSSIQRQEISRTYFIKIFNIFLKLFHPIQVFLFLVFNNVSES